MRGGEEINHAFTQWECFRKKYHKVALLDSTVIFPCKGQDKPRKRIGKECPFLGPRVMCTVNRVSAPRWVI